MALLIKVKASTVIETLVSLTILLISAGFCLVVFTNINASDLSVKKSIGRNLAYAALINAETNDLLFDESYSENEFQIEKSIEKVKSSTNLSILKITVSSNNRKLITLQKLIVNDQN